MANADLEPVASDVVISAGRVGDHPTTAVLVIVVPVALIANGFLAEVENNAPGGFLSVKKAEGKGEENKKSK